MWATILQVALEGAKAAPSRRELLAYLAIAAVCIGSSVMLGGCSSNQLPQISIEVIPPGSKPSTVVVNNPPQSAGATSVPQK